MDFFLLSFVDRIAGMLNGYFIFDSVVLLLILILVINHFLFLTFLVISNYNFDNINNQSLLSLKSLVLEPMAYESSMSLLNFLIDQILFMFSNVKKIYDFFIARKIYLTIIFQKENMNYLNYYGEDYFDNN